MEEKQETLSILMFPWLAHGHLYPFFELAKRLSAKSFKTYICSTPINLDSIVVNAKESSIELLELHVPSSPELPPAMHTTKNLPSHLIPSLIEAFQESSASFAQILDDKRPDLVIYDMFQPWAPKLASSMGIPAVCFAVGGTASFAYYHHMYAAAKTEGGGGDFPSETVYFLDHERIGTIGLIDPLLKDADFEEFAFGNFARSSEIVLMRSCRAVEQKYGDYLSSLCKKEVVTTGPLVGDYGGTGQLSGSDGGDALEWLGEKERCSTLYISFGSEHFLSEQEIREIAKALEICDGVNFIWVIRFSPDDAHRSLDRVLPWKFLDKTKGRGMIVTGWAPQQKILAHPNIGGFLSHCGNSSITEAMIFGVPVIAVPMKYEQPLNARLLVEAGFATEVAGKPSEIKGVCNSYEGEEIAKGIKKVFVEKESGEGMRNRAKEISQKVKETEEDEVSYLAERLFNLCIKYKQSRR